MDPTLAALLIRLVELDDGRYETFHPHFPGGGGREANLLEHNGKTIPEGPTKELANRGYLEMEAHSGKRLGKFRISEEGRALAAQLASAGKEGVDLSWPVVEPVLRQINNIWKREGAPQLGISGAKIMSEIESPPETAQFAAILQELARADWIEYRQGLGPQLPQGVRPTSRTLALFDGWPTEDARLAGEQFIALLEERIEAEPDAEKQSKLRAALMTGGTALKDLSVEVAATIVARQIGG